MDGFLKDRQLEKETYAIINYFKLLRQAEMAEIETYDSRYLPEETFLLIGGGDSYDRLLLDYQEGNIDVFSNSIGSLFQKLEENVEYMSKINFSQSSLAEKVASDFELIKMFYSDIYSVNGNQNESAIYDLVTLPLPENMISEIEKLKPKQKKLGER